MPRVRESWDSKILQDALRQSGLSQRSLARRLGLRSHSELSRILSGRRRPSTRLLLLMCEHLRIEGRALQKVLQVFFPSVLGVKASAFVRQMSGSQPQGGETPSGMADAPRSKNLKFFSSVYGPLVFEALKIIGPCTNHELYDSFSGALKLDPIVFQQALESLRRGGFATLNPEGLWVALEDKRDHVLPSGTTPREGVEAIRFALRNTALMIPAQGKRLMRSAVVTTHCEADASPVDAVRQLILNLQDDLPAQQSEGDNAVLQVLVSVI